MYGYSEESPAVLLSATYCTYEQKTTLAGAWIRARKGQRISHVCPKEHVNKEPVTLLHMCAHLQGLPSPAVHKVPTRKELFLYTDHVKGTYH